MLTSGSEIYSASFERPSAATFLENQVGSYQWHLLVDTMAQISSSNGFKQNVSPALGTSGAQDVGKEEALQMEAEALAKLQREKKTTLNLETMSCNGANQRALSSSRSERDLIVFPESDARKRAEGDAFKDIDVEKLTNAELEKLLLDDNFGANNKAPRPATLPGTPVLSSSFSGQLYSQTPFHGGQWNPGLTGSANSAVPGPVIQTSLYPAAAFPKQACPFQNGFNPRMPSYRAPEPVYLSAQPQYMPFPLQPSAPLHSTAVMPVYQQPVTPELAKLFDKIASTSEYLKNGKSTSTDLESAITKAMIPKLQTSENTNMSKFEWLDLDPLSKPRLDSAEVAQHIEGAVKEESSVAGDPWDAVLQDESTPESSLPPGKCGRSASFHPNGKSPAGTSVTRSQSLNIRPTSAQPPKTPGQTTETDKGTRSSPTACDVLQELEAQNEETDKGTSSSPTACDVLQELEAQNEAVEAFCEEIAKLRLKFPHDDLSTNPGYVLSPVMLQRDSNGEHASIKVSIEIEGSQQPVTFTCDVSSPVELLIMQALCWVHDDLNQVDIGSYILKVCGQEEVLQKKGLSQSALPYRRSVPTWLKLTSEDVKEQIYKLAKKGLTPSQIGVILRDSHGVAQVRFVTGNKILRILKSKGLAPDLPEDLYHLIKKAVAVRKHLERSRKDKDAKFRLILVESRIHRLARYYKSKRVLPPNWK
ncbi:UNVERIFIED_CONTAM: hypothetical protein FKN15_051139 [Acipenser sinensis]